MHKNITLFGIIFAVGCGTGTPSGSAPPAVIKDCAAGTISIPFSTDKTCVGQDFANMRVCLESSMDSTIIKKESDDVLTSVGVTVSSSNALTIGVDNAVKLTNDILAKAKPDPNGCNQIKACLVTAHLPTTDIKCGQQQ